MTQRGCRMSADSSGVKRSLVGVLIALAVGLVLSILITRPSAVTGSLAAVSQYENSSVDIASRDADFDFVDHELRYAGGYGLQPASAAARSASFDFLDHELRYAGGYGLHPAATTARGAEFDFLDHELRVAGGYGLRAVAVGARGADFDFLDHELRYAGGYALAPVNSDSSR